MKKRLVVGLMISTMVASMFAGCGDSKESSSKGGTESAKTEESAGDGSVYLLNFKPESDGAWQELASTYKDQTGVDVTVLTAADGTYNQTLTSEMAKDKAPTIYRIGSAQDASTWSDYLYDLKDSALYDHLIDKSLSIEHDGKVAAVANCYECYGLIYNKTILEDYCSKYEGAVIKSVDEINNFETLKKVAEDINNNVDKINEALGTELTEAFASAGLDSGSSWRFSGHLANMPLFYEFRDDKVTSQPATVTGKYLDNYKNLWDLYINNATVAPTTLATKTGDDAVAEFVNKQAAFYQNGTWAYGDVAALGDDNIGMLPIYIGVEGEEKQGLCTGTENYWCVNAKADEKDIKATLDFMKWCVTDEVAVKAMCGTEKAMPSGEAGMGFVIPFKSCLESTNVLVNQANKYVKDGKVSVSWNFPTMPSEEWKNGVGSALTTYAADSTDANWDLVVKAFVDGWKTEAAK